MVTPSRVQGQDPDIMDMEISKLPCVEFVRGDPDTARTHSDFQFRLKYRHGDLSLALVGFSSYMDDQEKLKTMLLDEHKFIEAIRVLTEKFSGNFGHVLIRTPDSISHYVIYDTQNYNNYICIEISDVFNLTRRNERFEEAIRRFTV